MLPDLNRHRHCIRRVHLTLDWLTCRMQSVIVWHMHWMVTQAGRQAMAMLHFSPLCAFLDCVGARRNVVTVCLQLRHKEADGEPRMMRQLMLEITQMFLLCDMRPIFGVPMFGLSSRQILLP